MRPNNRLLILIVSGAVLGAAILPLNSAKAQESSVNTFSPYTMYGVGNENFTGSTHLAGMAGTGIAWKNGGFDTDAEIRVNTLNPASLGGLAGGRSFILDVGLSGTGTYLRQNNGSGGTVNTSYNTFNVNHITVAFPLARKLGMAVNVSPYSQIGYRIRRDDMSHLADLGMVRYLYYGEGDMAEMKAQLGWDIAKWISVGAEFNYLWGDINRTYQATVYPYTGSGDYSQVSPTSGAIAVTNERVSRIAGNFGVQFTPVNKRKTRLTIGATYRLGAPLNSKIVDYIPSNNIIGDIIRQDEYTSAQYIPQAIGVGVFFHRPKFAVGFDYVYQDWGRCNAYDQANGVGYVNTNTFKFGLQYTPNRRDVGVKAGNFFNRITYRLGLRYNDYYMQFGGKKLNEKAITIGLDIPFGSMKVSNMSVGLEFGERGRLGLDDRQRQLIRERYWKISVGVMLFGRDHDYWFEKYKYN